MKLDLPSGTQMSVNEVGECIECVYHLAQLSARVVSNKTPVARTAPNESSARTSDVSFISAGATGHEPPVIDRPLSRASFSSSPLSFSLLYLLRSMFLSRLSASTHPTPLMLAE